MSGIKDRIKRSIDFAAELIANSKHTVVLSGAGISTPSGIPDFRSEGSGLWVNMDEMDAASLISFRYQPDKFFSWVRPLLTKITEADPNPAHIALAELEAAGFLDTIITQNIDNLHQRAGSSHVLEVHGSIRSLTCLQCYEQTASEDVIEKFLKDGKTPHCKSCSGVLKPDLILFGEQLPQEVFYKAQQACRNCGLMIVAGSSLEVMPIAALPLQAVDRGAHLIIINHNPTYMAERADVVILEDVADVLPAITARVLNGS